jgi:glycogen synthase
MFTHFRDDWSKVMHTGMSQDRSWQESARGYVQVYERAQAAAMK